MRRVVVETEFGLFKSWDGPDVEFAVCDGHLSVYDYSMRKDSNVDALVFACAPGTWRRAQVMVMPENQGQTKA